MPRLQILHHKSYHPYLEKNKQRVREDEARAAAAELAIEQSRIDAASSARLDELRKRAGSPSFRPPSPVENLPSTSADPLGAAGPSSRLLEKHKKEKARQEKREKKQKERLDFDFPSESAKRDERRRARKEEGGVGKVDREDMWVDDAGQGEDASSVWESGGHINLFADVEKNERTQPSLADLAKKKKDQEADWTTMYLGRPEKETKPWYTDRDLKRYEEKEAGEDADFRRARDARKDVRSKARHDPLTQISSLLASSFGSKSAPRPRQPRPGTASVGDAAAPRISRETSERQRALELIAKTKAQAAARAGGNRWDDTPSTIGGSRTWAEDFERQKDKAGMRFFDGSRRDPTRTGGGGRAWDGTSRNGRSWEV